jgi:hypothetical protein
LSENKVEAKGEEKKEAKAGAAANATNGSNATKPVTFGPRD